jgi:DNA polymerase III psi subunit
VHALETTDVAAFTTTQIRAFETADLVQMSTDQIHAFTTSQVAALTTAQAAALTTEHVVAMSTSQLASLTTADIAAMTTDQIHVLSTADITALHLAGKTDAFTAAHVAILDTDQLNAFLASPIALDLDGNGIQTVDASHGVNFDMTATGVAQKVGWVAGNDGFLVRDVNHDGVVNDGSEMFGTATTLATGGKAKDGFDALQSFDSNHDGVINSHDAVYKELKVWIDANHDGVSQAGEMHSLQSFGVSQLNLNAAHTAVNNNGNWVVLDSTYTTTDGQTHQMADVWFQNTGATLDVSHLSTAQVAQLTPEQVHTLSTAQIAEMTPEQVAALSTADIAALSQDQVKSLSMDDIAALHHLGKDDAFTAQQIQALVKPHLAVSSCDDIALFGDVHVHTNVVAGTDQLQLFISGDETARVELIGHHGDWKDVGTMLVNGAEHHVYNNGHTQIVIQGSVMATEKDITHG